MLTTKQHQHVDKVAMISTHRRDATGGHPLPNRPGYRPA
jgi:hypothetical protein